MRPRLVVSRCLGFAACRWNGLMISSPEVSALARYVEFVDVCPEVETGLSIPRDPVRIVAKNGAERLVQPATGRDITDEMTRFAVEWLARVGSVDGFVLKSRSPSCGMKDTKVYPSAAHAAPIGRTRGLFAAQVASRFPGVPLEDEGRLTNFRIREQFLTAVFTLADFRELQERVLGHGASRKEAARLLTEFHARAKLLLMAQSGSQMRRLGRIAANPQGAQVEEVWSAYADGLLQAFERPAHPTNTINVLEHAMGYFKTQLLAREKRLFLEMLDAYRAGPNAAERSNSRAAGLDRSLRRVLPRGPDVLFALPPGTRQHPRLRSGALKIIRPDATRSSCA